MFRDIKVQSMQFKFTVVRKDRMLSVYLFVYLIQTFQVKFDLKVSYELTAFNII